MAENNPFTDEAVEADTVLGGTAVGVAAALDQAKGDPAMRDQVSAFLEKQSALTDVQMHHLHEVFRQIRLRLWSERLRLAFQALTVLAGLAVAVTLAAIVWDAHRANGVVIEAFSAPPALAQRGLTGEAVADRLMDDLAALSETAASQDQRRNIEADWGKSLSIEIPETGLSLTELDKWLREKLGHETHISGELISEPDGSLTLVARDGAHGLPVLTGAETDVASLIQRTAEAIFGHEQPRTYYLYLMKQKRLDEALVFARTLAENLSASADERAFAYNAIGNIEARMTGDADAADAFRQAIMLEPDYVYPLVNLSDLEYRLGHVESGFQLLQRASQAALVPNPAYYTQKARLQILDRIEGLAAAAVGDYRTASDRYLKLSRQLLLGNPSAFNSFDADLASVEAALHEISAARARLAAFIQQGDLADARHADLAIRLAAEDWAGVAATADAIMTDAASKAPIQADMAPHTAKAIALAHLGRLAEAAALIDATPADCQPCSSARGVIASLAGDAPTADRWFSEAARMAPSVPFARIAWGRSLLDRHQPDRAIAQFQQALASGPRFADPLELWGEALMMKGDPKGAANKFAEAAAFAPGWGADHLRWGEALAALGERDKAQAQFNAARGMDQTADDQAALAKLN